MPKDSDLVSSQTHELNYLLKKWDKKQSRKNRDILKDVLKDFKADESYKPHTRGNFYKYVEDHDILKLLEDEEKKSTGKKSIIPNVEMSDLTMDEPFIHKDKAGKKTTKKQKIKKQKIQIQDLTQYQGKKPAGKLPGEKAGKIKKASTGGLKKDSKKKLILILIIILAVVLIVAIISVGTCMYQNARAKKTDHSLQEDVPKDAQPTDVTSVTQEKIYTIDSLKDFLDTCTPIYFIGDLDEFIKGDDRKIERLASYLDNYTHAELSIQGHTASIGQPENEMDLSIKRAYNVAELLKRKTKKADLVLKTRGYGATMEVIKNPKREEMKLNRRVEITVVKAESD